MIYRKKLRNNELEIDKQTYLGEERRGEERRLLATDVKE